MVALAADSRAFPKLASRHAHPTGPLSYVPPAVTVSARGDYRVLVTASREWPDPLAIWRFLDDVHAKATDNGHRRIVVVHGDAVGGDQVAKLWGQVTDAADHEAHPAGWTGPCDPMCPPGHRKRRKDGTEYCPLAGINRNYEMVKTGVDECGAFIFENSSGASNCAVVARREGVPVSEFRAYRH